MDLLTSFDAASFVVFIMDGLRAFLPRIAIALVVFIIGWWIINSIVSFIGARTARSRVDPSLRTFFKSLARIGLRIILFITIISILGIQTTSFVALLGAMGLAVGLALQGSLSNFAGGVLILMLKPYKVGDFVQIQGQMGTVESIQIIYTVLKTPDNITITIPNGQAANNVITNYSLEPRRRVDLTFGISYDDDMKKAKRIIQKVITQDARILTDPAPLIAVSELSDSAVNLLLRYWVEPKNLLASRYELTEAVKDAFDRNGITIPYPHRTVYVKK